jgi:hypothetical protein
MIIGQNGPLNDAQADAAKQDAQESKRLKSLSNAGLIGEIRKAQNTIGKTNHLCYAMAAVLLTVMKAPSTDPDPYRLKWSGTRAKTSRNKTKKGEVTVKL